MNVPNSSYHVVIYRPPKLTSGFIQEFADLSSVTVIKVLILGDLNIHVCCPAFSPLAPDFIKLLDSFNMTQHVKHPIVKGTYLGLGTEL